MVEYENRSRRNNLLVFGIKESASETDIDLKEAVVKKVFQDKLGVEIKTVERIHRLGRIKKGKTRPVIMRFYDYKEKEHVMKNCYKLKGSSYSVSNDYAPETVWPQVRVPCAMSFLKHFDPSKIPRTRALWMRLTRLTCEIKRVPAHSDKLTTDVCDLIGPNSKRRQHESNVKCIVMILYARDRAWFFMAALRIWRRQSRLPREQERKCPRLSHPE
ncbi:hypothetical protein HPB49_009750 [Dermacentor silvarum]|uniref:Uncharacterized protein n=1 Tax=Dermacentor silvarum TaxID=543639 RepID=A0ACB8DYQ8_DERSI|nr:hypothetical protein HPB49_009750 [Dermacentor silvarum]